MENPKSQPPPALTFPTVHLNGTSYAGLYDPLVRASDAARDAIAALAECAPHGRDYYPQGERAFQKARAEHLSRVSRMESVLKEIRAISNKVRGST